MDNVYINRYYLRGLEYPKTKNGYDGIVTGAGIMPSLVGRGTVE